MHPDRQDHVSDPNRMRWNTPDFYLKSRDEMMALFGELEDALDRTWEIAQRCHVKLEKVKEPVPALRRSRPSTPPTPTSNTSRARASRSAAARLEAHARQGQPEARPRRIRRAPGSRNQDDPEDEVLRLLPDRLGLHPLRQSAGHPGRPGPRFGRRQPGRATRWRSPTSTRCSTACCSSAS